MPSFAQPTRLTSSALGRIFAAFGRHAASVAGLRSSHVPSARSSKRWVYKAPLSHPGLDMLLVSSRHHPIQSSHSSQ